MSGIFGIYQHDGSPVLPATIDSARAAIAEWGPDGVQVHVAGPLAFMQARFFDTPEAPFEKLPVATEHVVFTAAGRLDYRDDLASALAIPHHELATMADGELMLRAWAQWGASHLERLHGDWSFAAWQPSSRRLTVARDLFGMTALYYLATKSAVAFSTSRKALLALKLADSQLDELYLAQVVVAWNAYHGDRTPHRDLRRLPPGHLLEVQDRRVDVRRYASLHDTPQQSRLPRREYAEGLRAVLDDAVQSRIRARAKIASTLSGGLDSSSISVTAAHALRARGETLAAFTAVPDFANSASPRPSFGDEWDHAAATVKFAGNIEHVRVSNEAACPIATIRRSLAIHPEPLHSAGNLYWMHELFAMVRDRQRQVLLIGQVGNAALSWPGTRDSHSLLAILRFLGARAFSRQLAKRILPQQLLHRLPVDLAPTSSALRPDVVARLQLNARMQRENPRFPTIEQRKRRMLRGGVSMTGSLWAEIGAAYGLSIRDPSADVRLIRFAHSVPDEVFTDLASGTERWLIREAMRGRLPEHVRLENRRGRQASDLVPRLRRNAPAVIQALDEVSKGPGAEYVDVPKMRRTLERVCVEDSPATYMDAFGVLCRGLMAGLFVNQFFGSGAP